MHADQVETDSNPVMFIFNNDFCVNYYEFQSWS